MQRSGRLQLLGEHPVCNHEIYIGSADDGPRTFLHGPATPFSADSVHDVDASIHVYPAWRVIRHDSHPHQQLPAGGTRASGATSPSCDSETISSTAGKFSHHHDDPGLRTSITFGGTCHGSSCRLPTLESEGRLCGYFGPGRVFCAYTSSDGTSARNISFA
jgi:hypothetical protein